MDKVVFVAPIVSRYDAVTAASHMVQVGSSAAAAGREINARAKQRANIEIHLALTGFIERIFGVNVNFSSGSR